MQNFINPPSPLSAAYRRMQSAKGIVTASVARIAQPETEPSSVGQAPGAAAAVFGASLSLEQADVLLRRTDQYAQWQRIRQKNDTEAGRLAPIILARAGLLAQNAQGRSIRWQEFDQLTAQLRHAGIALPSSKEILSGQFALPKSSAPVVPGPSPVKKNRLLPATPASAPLAEENLLLLNAVSPAIGLKQEMVGYGNGATTLLPLSGVARALDFQLHVDADRGVANGWFLSEERTFALDVSRQTVAVAGKSLPWDAGAVAVGEGDIFVDSKTLSQWFPVDFAVSTGEMTVTLTPREKLPIQAQYERERKRSALAGLGDEPLKNEANAASYDWFSPPVADVALTSGIDSANGGDAALSLRHSIVAEGDVGRMGAKLFVAGDEDDPLDNARFKLERLDHLAGLLGPMHASQVAVGDVSPVALPILGSRSSERGMAVSNGDVRRSRDFDVTRFEGNMQPGWDVELYQNGNLIESVQVGTDGRYLFENVPVYFGGNDFQLLAHGPQGQRRMIESKSVNVGSGMLKRGKLEYSLSATQQKQSLLGVDATDPKDGKGARLTSKFAYGLTDQLSATVGASTAEIDGVRHDYLQTGLGGSLSSLYGEANAIEDSAGGSGYSVQGQMALGPVSLRAKHELFSDFIDEAVPERILDERSSVGVTGRLQDVFALPPLSWTLSRENTVYEDASLERATARLSGQVKRLHLSNALHWNDGDLASVSAAPVDGEFMASGSVGRGRLTAGLQYDLGDDATFTQYNLSGSWPIMQGVTGGGDLTHDVDADKGTTVRANLALDNGKYILSPSLAYNSERGFGAFLGITFSFGQDPMSGDLAMKSEKRSGSGAATALVYHDVNNNQVFDEQDEPLPEVSVRAVQARQKATTGSDGTAQFTRLTAFEPTDVEIDPDSLEDPMWQPSGSGAAVMPRSGKVQTLQLPVVTTGEIDGAVFLQRAGNVREPLSNVRLEIVDAKGASTRATTSEHDGFYLFEKVPPGTYTVRVGGKDPRLAGVEFKSQEVVIGNDGTIARGRDIVLIEKAKGANPRPHPAAGASVPAGDPERSGPAVAPAVPAAAPSQSINIRPLTVVRPRPVAKTEGSSAAQANADFGQPFTVHLASYKTKEAARVGEALLGRRLAGLVSPGELTIERVDLGKEKGVWHRVNCGRFSRKVDADAFAARLRTKTEYARVVVVRDDAGQSGILPAPAVAPGNNARANAAVIAGKYAAMQQARRKG